MKEIKINGEYYCELETNFKPIKHLKKKQRKKYYVVNWGCKHSKLLGALRKKYKYINVYKYHYIGHIVDYELCRQIKYNLHKRGCIY